MLPSQTIKKAFALALAFSAIAPAAASARLVGGGSSVATPTPTPPATSIVRVTAPSSGFDWADAGIGAGGALGLSMVGLGGALALSQRHTRQTRRATGVAS